MQIILTNFRFPELCQILNDQAGFEKYMEKMVGMAKVCTEMVRALNELRSKATERENRPYDRIKGTGDVYDWLSDREKEKVCASLLDRQKFFMDSFSEIMGRLNDALSVQKDAGGDPCGK